MTDTLEINGASINRVEFIAETAMRIMAGLVVGMKQMSDNKVDDKLWDQSITAVSAAEHLWNALTGILMDDDNDVCDECREKEKKH